MKKIIIFISAILLLTGCRDAVEEKPMVVSRCADCPEARTSGRAFVAGKKAYLWAGRSQKQAYHNDIWVYDPATNTWEQKTDIPLKSRVRPCAIVVNEEVYMGLGYHGTFFQDSTYLRDWWRFRPETGEWTRLKDYPCNQTLGAVAMTDGEYIYVGFGCMQEENRDVYRYNIATDQWTKMADDTQGRHTFPSHSQGVAAADCQGRHFVGTGIYWSSLNYWAELIADGEKAVWKKRADVPGKGRTCASAAAGKDAIWLAGGRHWGGTVTNGEVMADVLYYDPVKDRWSHCATLPDGPRENLFGWVIDGKVYFGLGNDKYDQPCNQLYCIEP